MAQIGRVNIAFNSGYGCEILMLKRLFDVAAAGVGLLLLAPVIAVVAILIRSKLGSPVFFRQTRPGLHGKPFEMVKFRPCWTHKTRTVTPSQILNE